MSSYGCVFEAFCGFDFGKTQVKAWEGSRPQTSILVGDYVAPKTFFCLSDKSLNLILLVKKVVND